MSVNCTGVSLEFCDRVFAQSTPFSDQHGIKRCDKKLKNGKWKEKMLFNYGKKLTVRAVYQNKKTRDSPP